MPNTPEIRTVVEAAERAAAAGDHASAEAFLREAALLQESSLGPLHPDLANTLNNLGIVCEITGKPDDAERCFRRAWTIATTALPSDHPFVATSRKNLDDFCAAHGKAIDSPPPAVAVGRDARAPGAADRQAERSSREAEPRAPRPVPARTQRRSPATGTLIAAGVFVMLVATATWYRSTGEGEPRPAGPSASQPERPATVASPPGGSDVPGVPDKTEAGAPARVDVTDQAPPPRGVTPLPAGGAIREPVPGPTAQERQTTRTAAARPLVVADARLCRELSTAGQREWQCVPPSDPVGPGPLLFYTRLKSPTDTTVEHRWYRGGFLHQVVGLRIRANTGPGYRTYSRNTIGSERSGDWRVEIRTEDGVLLHEERFVVR